VLRVLHESAGVVEAGEPLVEIGNPGELEIVVDFLSSDAVRIEPGQRVIIEEWGGETALQGQVAKVEPYGFTKISALGINEQRVNVVIDFTDPPARLSRLGHGFQVEARVVLWEDDAVLKVPLTALFRDGDGWAVFVVDEARARLQPVVIGHEADFEAEIVTGVSEGDVIIRYPNNHVMEGATVRQR
jgi:HlyD family secretion protein